MTAPAFIGTENLSRIYRTGTMEVAALSQVTIAVSQGQGVGISGTSGSGKSTLMNLLGGLDTATEGRIHPHAPGGRHQSRVSPAPRLKSPFPEQNQGK